MKFHQCICRSLVAGILAAASLTVTAQTTTAPETPARVQPTRTPGILQGPNAGFGLGGPIGVLTEPQRTSYDTALNNERGQLADLQAKLRAARQDFLTTSLDHKFDENALRQKALAASRFEAELSVLRAKALSQVQPPLTPEQIEKIKGAQAGPNQPFRRPQQLAPQHAPASGTNQDANGLPPKK